MVYLLFNGNNLNGNLIYWNLIGIEFNLKRSENSKVWFKNAHSRKIKWYQTRKRCDFFLARQAFSFKVTQYDKRLYKICCPCVCDINLISNSGGARSHRMLDKMQQRSKWRWNWDSLALKWQNCTNCNDWLSNHVHL